MTLDIVQHLLSTEAQSDTLIVDAKAKAAALYAETDARAEALRQSLKTEKQEIAETAQNDADQRVLKIQHDIHIRWESTVGTIEGHAQKNTAATQTWLLERLCA
jgi:vacuolar-type H+-ATPase subunit H